MPCDKPRDGWLVNGQLKFEIPNGGEGKFLKIPCRLCRGCRLDHYQQWSVRMMHEAQMHQANQFVTLTYDEEHLPSDRSLDRSDYQNFLKRLRKEFAPLRIRFFLCGEYGSKTSRPHYHAILFGLPLADLESEAKNKRGELLFGSAKLDEIWGKGHCIVGDVTHQSCGYVASYMLKDMDGNYRKDQPYEVLNVSTGEVEERVRPFVAMSNRPGIGAEFFYRYRDDMFPHGFAVVKKGDKYVKTAIPEYYWRLLERESPELHRELMDDREFLTEDPKFLAEHSPERLAVRAEARESRIATFGSKGSDEKSGVRLAVIAPDDPEREAFENALLELVE